MSVSVDVTRDLGATPQVINDSSRNALWPTFSTDSLREKVAFSSFLIASYLTDPVCKTHEFYRRIYVVDALNPQGSALSNLARKIALLTGVVACSVLAVFTGLPGIGLRYFGAYIQKNPYIYSQGDVRAKTLPTDRTFSLLSWNVCCIGAGYSITDGGLMPWSFRLDNIVKKIIEKNADVNCLYETFDSITSFYICEKLKENGYKHFYFNIGPNVIGVSSGILVASKYDIKNPEFTLFPKDTLVGKTKYAAKGVFSFDLNSSGKNFARIYATHLQNSEEPEFPIAEEIDGRKKQMQIIVDKIDKIRDRCVVVTGDLNLDDNEYKKSSWKSYFQKGDTFGDSEKTWGGDEFCARMLGKSISRPLNLDHTMVVKGTARSISTTLVPTGFEPSVFKEEALSDHLGVLSRIGV